MRIGIYKDTLANNRGADKAVAALAKGLRERGHDAVLFEKSNFAARMKEPWDVVISTGTNELLDLYDYFSLRFKKTDPLFPWPVIQQFHTNPQSQFKWKRFRRNWRIRQALRHVSAIQVLSERFVPQVAKYDAPVFVIGNWSAYDGLAAKHAKKVIIYPAAFAKGKNQKLLIKAFARISNEFPEWELRLLGRAEGRYADECRSLAEKLGKGRIGFAGFCEDMAAEYGRCAFVAFPSIDEGFPLTLADAAAFAKPCVMARDWIGTVGAGGGIAAKPTVEAYAKGLRRLMSDEGLRIRMGEAAQKFCEENYSRDRILDKWETLLKCAPWGSISHPSSDYPARDGDVEKRSPRHQREVEAVRMGRKENLGSLRPSKNSQSSV